MPVKGPWAPAPQHVKIDPWLSSIVKDALYRTRHLHDEKDANGDKTGASTTGHQRGARDARAAAVPPPPPLVPGGGPHAEVRRNLPVFKYRGAVLEALRAPASLVEGETGSGKTTQVCQYLLEEAAETNTP
ncbi:hypothetical protein T484DRAFT_1795172, partial [Baffinella frigidus]